jgi:hypothetical protein
MTAVLWVFGPFKCSALGPNNKLIADTERDGWLTTCGTWAIDPRPRYNVNDELEIRWYVTHRPTGHRTEDFPGCAEAVRYCQGMNHRGDFSKSFRTTPSSKGGDLVVSDDSQYGLMEQAHKAVMAEIRGERPQASPSQTDSGVANK